MCTTVLSQVPNPNTSTSVATNDLSLIWMDHNIIDSTSVIVAALDRATSSFPDLNGTVFGACSHPFSFAVECYTRDVPRVAFKREQGIGILAAFDVVELDSVVSCGSQVSLVGRNGQSIDLRVPTKASIAPPMCQILRALLRMLNCPAAYAAQSLPESNGMVVTS